MTNNKKTRVTTNMKNTIVNEINKMNSEEINELITVIKRRRQVLGSMAANLFTKGDKVTFENKFFEKIALKMLEKMLFGG